MLKKTEQIEADINPLYLFRFIFIQNQCWGKLLLKVMHYNIVLLPKKSN